ncbi:MAG TPA: cobamide remodeling phosphodiesterase CbiR [Anaerolineales bacterium]
MNYPFRLGTTSYIIPADILPNVQYLAGKVRDVELVLFEVNDGPSNLPTPAQVDELRKFGMVNDLSYTVHLPLDLRLGDGGKGDHLSLEKARRVIDCTLELEPWAYVTHLDGRAILPVDTSSHDVRCWEDQAVKALELVGNWIGDLQKLAVENLEGYPLDLHLNVLERIGVSRTVDVGHLWLDGHDPLDYLRAALPRTKVVHIHGVNGRDHNSLVHAPAEKLTLLLDELIRFNYTGVVTIEVFSEQDLFTSLQVLESLAVPKG